MPALQSARLAELQLLFDPGADPDALGVIGDSTALHAAAWSAAVERIDLLLRAGADPERKTAQGGTPLQIVEARAADPDAALDPAQSERAITLLRDAASRR